MRQEIKNVKTILQRAASGARMYHENIERIRRTCRPDVITQESKPFAELLLESMQKAREEITAEFLSLETSIKNRMTINAKDYNKDTVELIKILAPDVDELEAIAKQFEGNETMLRLFRKYCDDQQMIANLPLCGVDRLKAIRGMRDDIVYILSLAGEPTSATNRYGDSQLQHFAENFEKVFDNQIQAIGD